jgi:hypothetical protein
MLCAPSRVAWDVEPPTFVIAEMKMKAIELPPSQKVEDPQAGEIAFHVGVDPDRQWSLGLEQRGRRREWVDRLPFWGILLPPNSSVD